MKLVSIVGARPQFVKVAPLARSIDRQNKAGGKLIQHIIVHTGQHYDATMSDVFFKELEIPSVNFNLGVGSGRHGWQTGRMIEKIEEVLINIRPDMVVVFGDTNSTVAGSLAATKLHIPVSHVEAGLRSFNRCMPEEINRIVADHTSDILLAPTPTAMENLRAEGLIQRSVFAGDIMYDALLFNRDLAHQRSRILARLNLDPKNYGVVTLHRAENTDQNGRLQNVLAAFNDIAASELSLVFPVHPRTSKILAEQCPDWSAHKSLRMIEPVGYLDMLSLIENAKVTLTDSGGVQKEAFFLGCPCITLREETEWVETVRDGGNIIAGTNPERIKGSVLEWRDRSKTGDDDFSSFLSASFGDGHAADRIRDVLQSKCFTS